MESVTLQDINALLEKAPRNVLERVFGYIEGLLEQEEEMAFPDFTLTEEQKRSLEEIEKRPYSEHLSEESVVAEIRQKYGI